MKKKTEVPNKDEAQAIVNATTRYKQESESARIDRMRQNDENYNIYHLKQDWSHKAPGQSQEFLAKQAMAVEQITSFIVQGLADLGDDWFSVVKLDGVKSPMFSEGDIKKLLALGLRKAKLYTHIEDVLKLSLLGSLMITKVHTKMVNKPKYVTREKMSDQGKMETRVGLQQNKTRQLALSVVSPKDYYPDPTGRGLYEMEYFEEDLHSIKAQCKSAKNPKGIYDKAVVDQITADFGKLEEEAKQARLNGQNVVSSGSSRKRISLMECWGTIVDEDGEVLHENVVWTVANDQYLIRKPEPNPFWHQESPYVVSALIRVPKSVWHKALMDAPTKHNKALNEIYNLIFDNGMMAVHGIKQLRPDWCLDQSKLADGIKPGDTIEVNSACPPNGKVLETVATANMSPEAISAFNLTVGEFQQAALTNDLRLGVMPQRAVKATEVVAAEQSITSMLNGISRSIENQHIAEVLRKSWMTEIQHLEDFDTDEIVKLLGKEKAKLAQQSTRAKRFVDTVNGLTFQVFGLSYTLNKVKDFQKVQAFLQTLSQDPVLYEEFSKLYSPIKLLALIMRSLDIDPDRLQLDEEDQQQNSVGSIQGAGAGTPTVGGPDMQSQIPQANSANSGMPETIQSIAQPKFPPSRASTALQRGSA